MKNSITRRAAAKAIGLGTAAAFVAPAALANADPDADILELEREFLFVRDVEMPPLDKAASDAETLVMKAAPYQPEPKYTLAELDAEEAETLADLQRDGVLSDILRRRMAKHYPGMDYASGVRAMLADSREAARKYQAYLIAHEKAEAETGYQEKNRLAIQATDRAIALHEKILAAKPRTVAGLAVQLRALTASGYFGLDVSEKQISIVAASASQIAGA